MPPESANCAKAKRRLAHYLGKTNAPAKLAEAAPADTMAALHQRFNATMKPSPDPRTLQIAALRRAYAAGDVGAGDLVEDLIVRRAACDDPALWIAAVPDGALRRRARELDAIAAADRGAIARLPLFGIPFAVKDNIDVAAMPTTAACPAFAYTAGASAPVVAALLAAGAILVGKTNLDQFATGLVGTRSPYGTPRNPFDPRFIPGGSSSGSAVAVAAGLVSFALGTDTAGSGRVPAAFNNIVGLKPTRGSLSARGVVPACRSLDCVSILALTAGDARAVFDAAAGFDAADPFARRFAASGFDCSEASGFRFGVPDDGALDFFGDAASARLFAAAAAAMQGLGGTRVTVPFTPFREAADLLYRGPWVAERLHPVEAFIARAPEAVLPVTRGIIEGGRRYSALDAYRALYRLAELRRASEEIFRGIDVLLVPTAGTIYRTEEIAAEPVRLNANLGAYTNFVNLLDLAAIAVPAGFRDDGLPFGVSLIAPAFADRSLAALAARFAGRLDLPLGATGLRAEADAAPELDTSRIAIAVVGAHMSGMALNGELLRLGGRLVRKTRTAPFYRMFLLPGAPPRPGLVRVAPDRGASIEAEIWSLEAASFGAFVAAVPSPLSIGTLALADGGGVKGFLCEAVATQAARDISSFGSWRDFLAADGKRS
jgi:allophanate hydrolase